MVVSALGVYLDWLAGRLPNYLWLERFTLHWTRTKMKNRELHLFSILVAVGLLLLIVTGAVVASRDAASVAGHRATGACIGLLVIGLALWMMAVEARPWLKGLAWFAAGATVVNAWLGFLAGPASAPVSPLASMFHAFLAPLILSAVAAVAMGTSRSWQNEPIPIQDQGWPPLRGVARNTLVLVVIQVALGAAFRYGSISVMTHILGALVVAVFILTLVVLVTLMPEHPTLRPAAITLGVVTFVQIFLGLTVVSMGSSTNGKLAAPAFAVAHVATGAITLAATLVLALEVWRHVRPAMQPSTAANDQGFTS